MKRLLISILLLFTTTSYAEDMQLARTNPYIAGANYSAAAAKSCPTDETSLFSTIDQTDDFVGGIILSTRIFSGQGNFAPATDLGGTATICAISISVRSLAAAAFDTRIEIYEMSGVNLGSAPTGTCVSNTKNITGAGVVKFDGMSCQLITGTLYGIAIARPEHDYDETNYMTFFIDSAGSTSGGFWSWDGDKVRSDDNSTETVMQIWGFNP